MKLYLCNLTLHDNVFFATREMGVLYETEKYLHNWGLSYALFKTTYIPQYYGVSEELAQKPQYFNEDTNGQSLLHLNNNNIYVFPGKPLVFSYQINTFKAAQVSYYGKSQKFGESGGKNYPVNFGRAKELAVNSQYRIYILVSGTEIPVIPRWIRLGKWLAKVKVDFLEIPDNLIKIKNGEYLCDDPLNPIDLTPNNQILLYNRIIMPPSSLISQAKLKGEYLEIKGDDWKNYIANQPSQFYSLPTEIRLPLGVFYGANKK